MEFAVIKTGGKQYIVKEGDKLKVEKIRGVKEAGEKVTFDKVLMVDDGKNTSIGTPYLDGAKVEAEVVKIGRADKITVIKYLQKSRYFKKNGHRQPFVEVKILAIK